MTRIVGGVWRGRAIVAPPGIGTRPSAGRLRQALFDMLAHAPWATGVLPGAYVLDLFAGTGALGLEALSRGAAFAEFVEREPAALTALRRNVASLPTEGRTLVVAGDVLAGSAGPVPTLVLLDPPYGHSLVTAACLALARAGRVGAETLHVAEIARDDAPPHAAPLIDRRHGAGRIIAWRGPLP